jgi:uncharacterized protein (TIGR04141 family)
MDEEVNRLSVSVYLLKKGSVGEAQQELQAVAVEVHRLTDELQGGAFIRLPADPTTPKWLGYIAPLLNTAAPLDVTSQSPGGILWLPRGARTLLITFGHAHMKIKDEWVEPEFGKTVALAVVPQGSVREVRAEQVFAKRHIASERAPRTAAVRDFGFEPDRDLVSAVEGTPDSTYSSLLGVRVRGGVSLRVDVDFDRLVETLDCVLERFDSNDHQRRWPQATHLVVVRDEQLRLILDASLEATLLASHPENFIALAAPSERSGDKPYPQHFVVGRMSSAVATSPYLTFASWRNLLNARAIVLSLDAARRTKVHLLDENKEQIGSCSVFDCFGAEVSHNGATYVLSSGSWYLASQNFISDTMALLATVAQPSHLLSPWNSIDHEGPYNAGTCALDPDCWLFDKQLINFGGGSSRFEFCDVMHLPSRTLYFVKHPTGSAGVSHLCEQVRRTAENFFHPSPDFRTRLQGRIKATGKTWNTTWLGSLPKRHEWNLCLVLMGKSLTALPFFAKAGVARLVRELQRGGYNVSFQSV